MEIEERLHQLAGLVAGGRIGESLEVLDQASRGARSGAAVDVSGFLGVDVLTMMPCSAQLTLMASGAEHRRMPGLETLPLPRYM